MSASSFEAELEKLMSKVLRALPPEEALKLKSCITQNVVDSVAPEELMVRSCVSLVYAWRRHEAAPQNQAVQVAMINTLFALGEVMSQVMERNPAVFAGRLEAEAAAFERLLVRIREVEGSK